MGYFCEVYKFFIFEEKGPDYSGSKMLSLHGLSLIKRALKRLMHNVEGMEHFSKFVNSYREAKSGRYG